jgi:diaminohydroxyphosphoribosylaminopyrimidine deaminase/5-amino-6-(5-phosphoribosylamino)uracil reductase
MALELARKGHPTPNPPVGAVVATATGLVGRGWHEAAGGPHAEVVALGAAGPRARGATLYVTLEPCNHYGRTPPCVNVVLASRVRRVVIGCRDPNPEVAGGGARWLREQGVQVEIGVLGGAAVDLIAGWIRSLPHGRGRVPGDEELCRSHASETPRAPRGGDGSTPTNDKPSVRWATSAMSSRRS